MIVLLGVTLEEAENILQQFNGDCEVANDNRKLADDFQHMSC